jgi:hypothetical protein
VTEPVSPLDLALVIPVWNDAAGLARLLAQADAMGVFAQIVVVDDGSDVPVVAPGCTLIRHPSSQGGGLARNAGLAQVRTAHVLFFDADDLLTEELPLLLADLAGQDFDTCLFKHADSRVGAEPRWGQPDYDDRLWTEAGHASGAMRLASPEAVYLLAQTANYPWNKIYRTAFLRDHRIGCAATRVHQDIPLHWLGFIHAGRVLVSDRICAWHHIAPAGRLSNRSGVERLDVFVALEPVVQAAQTPQWRAALARFLPGLIDWAAARVDPELLGQLRAKERDFIAAHFAEQLPQMAKTDPDTAQTLRDRLT